MTEKIDYLDYVDILVHRVLAQHAAFEVCKECPPLTQRLIEEADS
jgi:hypothetical protein